jgi:hypothetical protein
VGKVTCDMTMSVDGFVAGPNQSLENAFGEGAEVWGTQIRSCCKSGDSAAGAD